MQLLNRIREWFKPTPPPPPTIDRAWARLYELCETYEEILWYITQIPDFKPPEVFVQYAERAEFALTSARDELKIIINEREDLEHGKRIEKAVKDRVNATNT